MPSPLRPLALLAALSFAGCPAPALPTAPVTTGGSPGGAPASSKPLPAAPSSPCLSLVGWNDMHGQIAPDDPLMDMNRVPAGGVIAVADQIAQIRASGDDVVVLDAGDLFTGPLASTLAEGAPIIEAYAIMGVDAAAIGNHEFDFGPVGYARVIAPPGVGDEAGPDGPRGALLARMEAAPFPFLSANIHKKGGAPTGWPKHRASARIARGRYDVGVVGYTTLDTPKTTLKPNVSDLDFSTGAAAAVASQIRELRAAGSAPVVLLAHASIEGDLPQDLADPREARGEIATLVAALGADVPDVIIAGHRHAWMLGRVRGVPIVSSDQHGVGLSRVRFCREGAGAPRLSSIERRAAIASSPPGSALGRAVAAAMAPWQEKVKAEAEAPVSTLPRACVAQGPNGTALAEQVARVIAERVADAEAPPKGVPVVGLVNGGALRAPLPAGPIRFTEVFTVFPFENAVAACATTRSGVVRVVENALKKPSAREHFPFGIAGAKVTVKRGAGGALSLVGLEIDGMTKAAGGDTPVWLALPDFVLWGGDGLLEGVTCSKSASSSTRIRDAWRAVLAREHGGCEGAPRNILVP